MATTLNSLQDCLKTAYDSGTDSINVQQPMLTSLGDKTLVLMDFDVSPQELPLLQKFLNTKQIYKEVEHVIITLKPGVAPENRRRQPDKNTKQVARPAASKEANILVSAVFDFIKHSQALKTISIDHVTFSADQLNRLADALSHLKSEISELSFLNCETIESGGLRTLTPGINKLLSLNKLTIHNCGLNDQAAPYIASILRASESHMDQLFWNASLRSEVTSMDELDYISEDMQDIYTLGLVALDISGNSLTSKSLALLGRVLKSNHWLLALHLGANKFDENGLEGLLQNLSDNAALETILIAGNDGASGELASRLAAVTKYEVTRSKLEYLSDDVMASVDEWNKLMDLEANMAPSATASVLTERGDRENSSYRASASSSTSVISAASASDREKQKKQSSKKSSIAVSKWNELDGVSSSILMDGEVGDLPFEEEEDSEDPKHTLEFGIPSGGESPVASSANPVNMIPGENADDLSGRRGSDDFLYSLDADNPGSANSTANRRLDGRPPSRNSLRPRSNSQQQFESDSYANSGSGSGRSSYPNRGISEEPNIVGGRSKSAPDTNASGVSKSAQQFGSKGPLAKPAFYPGGPSNQYAEARASNKLEQRRNLMRSGGISMGTSVSASLPTRSHSSRSSRQEAFAMQSSGSSTRGMVKAPKKKKKAKKVKKTTGSGSFVKAEDINPDSWGPSPTKATTLLKSKSPKSVGKGKISLLAAAMEMMTKQLSSTTEKLCDVSDSLSETLNMSLNNSNSAVAQNTSAGSIGLVDRSSNSISNSIDISPMRANLSATTSPGRNGIVDRKGGKSKNSPSPSSSPGRNWPNEGLGEISNSNGNGSPRALSGERISEMIKQNIKRNLNEYMRRSRK